MSEKRRRRQDDQGGMSVTRRLQRTAERRAMTFGTQRKSRWNRRARSTFGTAVAKWSGSRCARRSIVQFSRCCSRRAARRPRRSESSVEAKAIRLQRSTSSAAGTITANPPPTPAAAASAASAIDCRHHRRDVQRGVASSSGARQRQLAGDLVERRSISTRCGATAAASAARRATAVPASASRASKATVSNYRGVNRFGGKSGACRSTITGKGHGAPISIGGVLYAWITPGAGAAGLREIHAPPQP